MLEQGVHDEAGVVGHVLHDHAQQVVHLTGQGGAFDDFGPGLHRGAEQVHGVAFVNLGMLFQTHIDVGREAQAHALGRHHRHVACDDFGFFQTLDAAQRGRGRQADLRSQNVVGHAAVELQRTQDATVYSV